MATTYRYFIEDILKTFKQNEVTSTLKFSQVFFWTITFANRYRARHVEKGYITGQYLNIFPSIPVLTASTNTSPNIIAGRKYFELPTAIYDYHNEKAIDYVTYETLGIEGFRRIKFQPTRPDIEEILEYTEYERPTPKNPYFYRVHENIYLLGVENVTIKTVEVGLFSALDTRVNLIDPDTIIDLDEQSISQLRIEVLSLGKFMMITPKQDRVADGAEEIDPQGLERTRSQQLAQPPPTE